VDQVVGNRGRQPPIFSSTHTFCGMRQKKNPCKPCAC
jgi:hypothetical protein